MNIALLLEMAADGAGERVALGPRSGGTSYRELLRLRQELGGVAGVAARPARRAA